MSRKLGLVAIAFVISWTAVKWGDLTPVWAAGRPQRARVLVTRPVDEGRLVPLAGNTRREANATNDRGRVPDDFLMEHMLLLLNRPPELEQQFEQYIESLTDKSSPNFHQWLMPDEQGELYGLAQEDVDTVTGWLQSHGFTVGYVYPNRRVIDFSGTAGEIREAFHTEIHHLNVKGEQHFANMSDPRIPEALAPVVLGVVSMSDFKPHSYLQPRTQYKVICEEKSCKGSSFNLLVPGDVQTIYNLTPVYRQGIYGQGQTIVVIEDAMPWSTDPTTYQNTFNLGVYGGSWTNTHPNAGGNCSAPASPNADEGEADIDVEIALAVAPGAAIQAASCSDGTPVCTFGGLLALENLVSAGTPPAVISMSYGECEAASPPSGHLYVIGGTGEQNNTLYAITIVGNAMTSGGASAGPQLATNYTNDFYAPGLQITEFCNNGSNACTASQGTDYLFLSVLGFGSSFTSNPCTGQSSSVGCIMGFTAPASGVVSSSATPNGTLQEAGGASGIVVDNGASGASNIYFSTLLTQTCTTSRTSGGCAVSATQAALQ